MAKEFAAAFYNSSTWHKCREAYIKSVGGLCEDCLAKGLYRPAKVVHHIKHITPETINDPAVCYGFDNLRAVCQDCHAEEHKRKNDRYIVGENGEIILL